MQLNFVKHFKKKDFNESEDEDYIPESEEHEHRNHKLKKMKPNSQKLNYENFKNEIEAQKKLVQRKTTEEMSLSIDQLTQIAKIALLELKKKIEISIPKQTEKTLNFADKFYVLMNDSMLREIERPKDIHEEAHVREERNLSHQERLQLKLEATQEIIKGINHGKHVKINSIMKSRFDWKKFVAQEKIEDKMKFHRKDDVAIQNYLAEKAKTEKNY